MNIETMARGLMIAQYIEMIDECEAILDTLNEGLHVLLNPDHEDSDICDDCHTEKVMDWLSRN